MRTEIAKNNYYELEIDTEKNRVYTKLMNKWTSIKEVPNFFADWKKIASMTKPNFTIFADIRLMGTLSKEVEILHQEIQTYLVEEKKLLETAQLASQDELADYQIHRSTKRSNLSIRKFATQEEAEQYLDKISKEKGN